LPSNPLRKSRAQETPDAKRTRSLACESKKAHEQVTTGSAGSSGVSRAMVLTAYSGLSLVNRLVVTIPGVKRQLHRRVDASIGASGPHGFAVRFLVHSSRALKASTASRPTFVTMANAPLSDETREAVGVICPTP
jgi:hypothetical protein